MNRVELLFAHWAVRFLKDARGPRWKKLIQQVESRPETDPDALALQLVMTRLNNCVACDARKYAERGGCARCSLATLALSKETEEGLLTRWRAARKEIARQVRASPEAEAA